MSDFWRAANAGNMPAVSFLKAPNYQNGHPYTSDPIDEQNYLVNTINRLQNLPEWNSMLIIVTWDDSDGWYDHVMPQIVSHLMILNMMIYLVEQVFVEMLNLGSTKIDVDTDLVFPS